MIDFLALKEIQTRDFLNKKDHFSKYKDITSGKIWGTYASNTPLVTILMPIYNHPVKCLERALKSAIAQKGNFRYQIIVVDNDSQNNNGNESIIRKINSDKILYFRNEKNIGMFGNWNRCISLARTEWVTFLHSDDMLKDNFLEIMCSIIANHKEIDQLACNYATYDADLFAENEIIQISTGTSIGHTLIRSVDVSEYFDRMVTSVKGALLKRSYLLELGGFRDLGEGLGASDYTTMLKYAFYYKTYLLNADLYLNGLGKNESLNLSYWYPELIANYYMQMFFNQFNSFIKRYFNKCRYINILLNKADAYNSGNNFLGQIIPIDTNELLKDCGIRKVSNRHYYKFTGKCVGLIKKIALFIKQKRFWILQ